MTFLTTRSCFCAVAITLVFVAVGACNQILGTKDPVARIEDLGDASDGETAAIPGMQCGLALPAGACASCIATSCCREANACADHPSCAHYETCTLKCEGDYACRAACLKTPPTPSNDDMPALESCVVDHCEEACGISCGVPFLPQQPDVAEACKECLADHACEKGKACGADLDCQKLGWCAFPCPTPDCQRACITAHPASAGKLGALYSALGSACLTCSRDGVWYCVGGVSWPLAKSDVITAVLTFTDTPLHPVVGLTVKACDRIDTACIHPAATGTTDANGKVSLSLPARPFTFGFSGYFDVSGDNILPHMFFLSFPLSEPIAEFDYVVLSKTGLAALTAAITDGSSGDKAAPFVVDPNRGAVALRASDCLHLGAAGVTVVAASGTDDKTLLRYYDYNAVSLSNTATMTDRSGLAFFLNVPTSAVEAVEIEARPGALGGAASSKTSVFTRRGALSIVQALPTP